MIDDLNKDQFDQIVILESVNTIFFICCFAVFVIVVTRRKIIEFEYSIWSKLEFIGQVGIVFLLVLVFSTKWSDHDVILIINSFGFLISIALLVSAGIIELNFNRHKKEHQND